MQIRDGGYYKQRNGMIRGPMLIAEDEGFAFEGTKSAKPRPMRWRLNGQYMPRSEAITNENVDLVEELAVFPMPEITDADRFVAHDNDGYALEFAGNYNSYTDDDCTLYLFTQSELLRMIKDQRDHLKTSVSLVLPTASEEDREALSQALAKLMGAGIAHFTNITPTKIMAFAVGAAHRIVESLTVHGFENDRGASLVLANHQDLIQDAIYKAATNLLREHGVSTFHDGGYVKGSGETLVGEHATGSFAFIGTAKSWAKGGFTGKPGLKPGEAAGVVATETIVPHEQAKKKGWVTEILARTDDRRLESLHLCKPAPTPYPTPGSVWQHRNGNSYAVVLISNAESERQEKYPTTVVYRNVENGKVYNRKLSDWHRSMTLADGALTEEDIHADDRNSDGHASFVGKMVGESIRDALAKMADREFIVAAAIHHGGIIFLPRPARHHTILQAMETEMQIGGVINPQQQGFITSTGRYVNRTEAWYIAQAAGQIIRKTSGEDTPNLYSEDLW
ncbi:MAG: hypothetical protein PBV01_10320 [Brucella anthropi]